ncbi:hypothetical protein D9M71_525080 [compost metagenome]
MEVEVAFLLVVADTRPERLVALVGFQHLAQLVDLVQGHALGRQAAGHAFQRLANLVQLDQFGLAERYHARTGMWHPDQQALPLQAADRLAQRAATDAVGARQLGLGDLAARSDVATHDGRLDAPEHMIRKGAGLIVHNGSFC